MASTELEQELVITGDGSHTIKVAQLKEHYHSHKGALRESEHVFIDMGLNFFSKNEHLRILEVGFGTGLNALLSALQDRSGSLTYIALEPNPLGEALVYQLNYPSLLSDSRADLVFQAIHSAAWEQACLIHDKFSLTKKESRLEDLNHPNQFDLIFYDAFAPHAQPELWTKPIWLKLFAMMSPNGLLVTYCAKGQVRRDLQDSGFEVERLPGPPGKREMLRAIKREVSK